MKTATRLSAGPTVAGTHGERPEDRLSLLSLSPSLLSLSPGHPLNRVLPAETPLVVALVALVAQGGFPTRGAGVPGAVLGGVGEPSVFTVRDWIRGRQQSDRERQRATSSCFCRSFDCRSYKAIFELIITYSNQYESESHPQSTKSQIATPRGATRATRATTTTHSNHRPRSESPAMTLTTDPWATLPPDWRNPRPKPQPTPIPEQRNATPRGPSARPTPRLKLPATPCQPWCATCGRHEPPGPATDGPQWKDQHGHYLTRQPPTHREPCGCQTWICDHVAQPGRNPICIVTRRTTARTVTASTGRRLLVVDLCPHCGRAHTHSPEPTSPYRLAGCGQPYLLETTR